MYRHVPAQPSAQLIAFMEQRSADEKRIAEKRQKRIEAQAKIANSMTEEEKREQKEKITAKILARRQLMSEEEKKLIEAHTRRTTEEKIADMRAKSKARVESETLIDYALEEDYLRALLLNCAVFLPYDMRIVISGKIDPLHKIPQRVATIRKSDIPMFRFLAHSSQNYGNEKKRLLRYRELKEAINIILPQITLIEVISVGSYIKLYQVNPAFGRKEVSCYSFPSEATTAETTKGGHLVSRVPLDSEGLRDGEEEMLILFEGVPLLRRYWRQGVRVKRSDYIAQVNALLDKAGIASDLHSIITNF